ncbi:MAG TPA: hypothetical protein VGF84_11865 [Micromonosporaceae bacterium]
MDIRAVAESSRIYTGRWLLAEAAALAVLLGLISRSPARQIALFIAAGLLIAVAVGRLHRRPVRARIITAAGWCARSRRPPVRAHVNGATLADRDGMVAVFELGPTNELVISGDLRLPDVGGWTPLIRGGPATHVQLVIERTPATSRVLLALRVATGDVTWAADTLPAALSMAVRRAERRLDALGIAHRRLDADELADATGVTEAPREAWDHIAVSGIIQVAVMVPLGPAGMTTDVLGRIATLATAVTWAGTDAVVRVDAVDEAGLTSVLDSLASTRRLDGDQIHGRRATLPLALDPRPPVSEHRLTLPPPGVRIGVDRAGNRLTIRVPPHSRPPLRIIVVGGPAAGVAITRSAAAVGVRLRPDVLDRPTATDAPALRAADVVICQPMPAVAAAAVATALGLSARTGEWLSRIDSGMVAVIADGRVRWALL